jgi:hypothetical protein
MLSCNLQVTSIFCSVGARNLFLYQIEYYLSTSMLILYTKEGGSVDCIFIFVCGLTYL